MALPKPSKSLVFRESGTLKLCRRQSCPQQSLRQFATQACGGTLKQARINKIITPMKSPFKPPKAPKIPAAKVIPANPLAPLKTYLP